MHFPKSALKKRRPVLWCLYPLNPLVLQTARKLFVLLLKLCFCHQPFLIKLNLTGYWCLKEDPYRFLSIPVFFLFSLNCFTRTEQACFSRLTRKLSMCCDDDV